MSRFVLTLFVVTIFLLLSSCSRDESPTSSSGGDKGTLIIRMTDSPAAYDSVVIHVDSVRVHISNADSVASGWYTISRTPAMYDLLVLTNGADTVIGSATVPPGTYSQLRLHIGSGSHVVVNGASHPLDIPSGSESGLKLNIHATIEANTIYTVMLDFDAARSIIRTGNGLYKLKPVIRTTVTAQTGSISGVVQPASTRPVVTAASLTDTVSTIADPSGAYRLVYLPASTYTVSFVPTDTTYNTFAITGVVVFPGITTPLGTVTLTPR